MASETTNLKLYKVDPVADGEDTFNIQTILNDNWDKIDQEVGILNSEIQDQSSQFITLNRGTQVVNVLEDTPFNVLEIRGKTTVGGDVIGFQSLTNPAIMRKDVNGAILDYLYVASGVDGDPVKLGANADNTIYDRLFMDEDGQMKVERKFEHMILDGRLPWLYHGKATTGYKNVYVAMSHQALSFDSGVASKYDGKIIPPTNTFTNRAEDLFGFTSGSDYKEVIFSINNIDSGWGETYTPTADEIKAYFLGWKLGVSGSGYDVLYTGTGTKRWASISEVNANNVTTSTTTLPTTPANGWVPYKLQYQLATPITENVQIEGGLSFVKGDNILDVAEGVIVRDKVKPWYNSGVNAYVINGGDSSANTQYKVLNFLSIYENDTDVFKSKATEYPRTTNNGTYAQIPANQFDPTATYYVTYLALPNENTASVEQVEAEYFTNLKSIVNEHTKDINSLQDKMFEVDRLNEITKTSAVEVRGGGTQSIASGVDTKVTLINTKNYDVRGEYDLASNRFIAKSDGIYHIRVWVDWGSQIPTVESFSKVVINGAMYGSIGYATTVKYNIGSAILSLKAGAVVELYINQGSSGTSRTLAYAALNIAKVG